MTAIEELRKLLDERGIEHEDMYTKLAPGIKDGWDSTWWRGIAGLEFHAVGDKIHERDGCVYINGKHLTPEQAIAATLGDADYERRMDELLCRLTNGKWSKSRSYSVDFMVSCVDEAYEDAALGGGECEWELEHSGTLYDKWRCSECKFLFVEPRCDHGYTDLVPNFCPNCGKAVKR